MAKLSAIIIAKNAEELIADCLDSLTFCDEIILIDDNSTDRTAEIAAHMGAKVIPTQNFIALRSFAEKRNFGLKKTKNKWVFYIDTDERVSPKLAESIKQIVNSRKQQHQAYRIQRQNFYFGKHEWPFIEKLERLFDKTALKGWQGELHETAVVDGTIGNLEGYLLHYTHRDLTSMISKTIDWSQTEAELRYNTNHPSMTWWRFPRVMLTAFWNSYIKQKGYKAGTAGLVESIYQAFSMFITYARLWEMQQTNKKP
jgi:glycosyltransferase involved in cell wall biosynthesis